MLAAADVPSPSTEGVPYARTQPDVKGGGGISRWFLDKAWSLVGFLMVVGIILYFTVQGPSTARLYGNTAVAGGTTAGIILASIPKFFGSMKTGQDLVKSGSPATTTPGKSAATTTKKGP
jgi:hypothetical protein